MNKTVSKCSNKVKFLYRNPGIEMLETFIKRPKSYLIVSALSVISTILRLYAMV